VVCTYLLCCNNNPCEMLLTCECGGAARHLDDTQESVKRDVAVMIEGRKLSLGRQGIDERPNLGYLSLYEPHCWRVLLLVSANVVHVSLVGNTKDGHATLIPGLEAVVLSESVCNLLVTCSNS
jgi:hypothetical protein